MTRIFLEAVFFSLNPCYLGGLGLLHPARPVADIAYPSRLPGSTATAVRYSGGGTALPERCLSSVFLIYGPKASCDARTCCV